MQISLDLLGTRKGGVPSTWAWECSHTWRTDGDERGFAKYTVMMISGYNML